MALSHKDIRALLEIALGDPPARGYLNIHDVWPDKFVYTVNNYDLNSSETYERAYSIDLDKKVTLGEATRVRAVTSYEPVVFSGVTVDAAVFSEDGTHEAKLFRLGDYPDKGFSLSTAEADQAIASFSPIPILLEHGKTAVKDVKFGDLEKIRREGDWLYGTTRFLPEAIKALKGSAPKLSMSFFRDTKRPREVSIVDVPRVAEAGLLAAFSADPETPRKPVAVVRTGSAMGVFGTLLKSIIGGQKPSDAEVEAVDAQFSALVPAAGGGVAATEKPGEATPVNFSVHIAKREAERIVEAYEDRLTPAEAEKQVAAFTAAIMATPAEFSVTGELKESDLVKSMREGLEARPPHVYGRRVSNFAATTTDDASKKAEALKPMSSAEACAAFSAGKEK